MAQNIVFSLSIDDTGFIGVVRRARDELRKLGNEEERLRSIASGNTAAMANQAASILSVTRAISGLNPSYSQLSANLARISKNANAAAAAIATFAQATQRVMQVPTGFGGTGPKAGRLTGGFLPNAQVLAAQALGAAVASALAPIRELQRLIALGNSLRVSALAVPWRPNFQMYGPSTALVPLRPLTGTTALVPLGERGIVPYQAPRQYGRPLGPSLSLVPYDPFFGQLPGVVIRATSAGAPPSRFLRLAALGGGGGDGGLALGGLGPAGFGAAALARSGNSFLQSIRSAFLIIAGFRVATGIRNMVKDALEFQRIIERTKIGIAEVLLVSNRFTNQFKQQLPPAQQLQAAFIEADIAINRLTADAIRFGLPLKELLRGFSTVAGQARASGVGLADTIDIMEQLTVVAQRTGLPFQQLVRSVDNIFTGLRVQQTQLGIILGLNQRLVQSWAAQGVLVERIRERLSAVKEAFAPAAETFDNLLNRLRTLGEVISAEVFQSTFMVLKGGVKDFGNFLENLYRNQDAMDRLAAGAAYFARSLVFAFENMQRIFLMAYQWRGVLLPLFASLAGGAAAVRLGFSRGIGMLGGAALATYGGFGALAAGLPAFLLGGHATAALSGMLSRSAAGITTRLQASSETGLVGAAAAGVFGNLAARGGQAIASRVLSVTAMRIAGIVAGITNVVGWIATIGATIYSILPYIRSSADKLSSYQDILEEIRRERENDLRNFEAALEDLRDLARRTGDENLTVALHDIYGEPLPLPGIRFRTVGLAGIVEPEEQMTLSPEEVTRRQLAFLRARTAGLRSLSPREREVESLRILKLQERMFGVERENLQQIIELNSKMFREKFDQEKSLMQLAQARIELAQAGLDYEAQLVRSRIEGIEVEQRRVELLSEQKNLELEISRARFELGITRTIGAEQAALTASDIELRSRMGLLEAGYGFAEATGGVTREGALQYLQARLGIEMALVENERRRRELVIEEIEARQRDFDREELILKQQREIAAERLRVEELILGLHLREAEIQLTALEATQKASERSAASQREAITAIINSMKSLMAPLDVGRPLTTAELERNAFISAMIAPYEAQLVGISTEGIQRSAQVDAARSRVNVLRQQAGLFALERANLARQNELEDIRRGQQAWENANRLTEAQANLNAIGEEAAVVWTRAAEAMRRYVGPEMVNYAENVRDAISDSLSALLGGRARDIGGVARQLGQTLMSSIIRGTVEKKFSGFDLMLKRNFLEYLPGVANLGGQRAGRAYAEGFEGRVLTPPAAGVGAYQAFGFSPSVTQPVMSGYPSFTDPYGTRFGGPNQAGAAAMSVGATGSQAGQGGNVVAAAATFGAIAAIAALAEYSSARRRVYERGYHGAEASGSIQRSMFEAAADAIGLGVIGRALGPLISKSPVAGLLLDPAGFAISGRLSGRAGAALSMGILGAIVGGPFGAILGAGFGAIFGSPFGRPTRGTIQKMVLERAFKEMNLPRVWGTNRGIALTAAEVEGGLRGLDTGPLGEEAALIGLLAGRTVFRRAPQRGLGQAISTTLLGAAAQLGLGEEDARDLVRSFAEQAFGNMRGGAISLLKARRRGKLTTTETATGIAELAIVFQDLPAIVDRASLALSAFGTNGTISIRAVERAAEDLKNLLTSGVQEGFKRALESGDMSTLLSSVATRMADIFNSRLAERMLEKGTFGKAFTEAVVYTEKAAEALAMGDRTAFQKYASLAQGAYRSGQQIALTTLAAVTGPAGGFLAGIGVPSGSGLIDQTFFGSPYTAPAVQQLGAFGVQAIPPPFIANQTAVNDARRSAAASLFVAPQVPMSGMSGAHAPVVIHSIVNIDGKPVAESVETAQVRQRYGMMNPNPGIGVQ